MGHATPWNPSTARSTKTSSRRSAASWQDVPGCGRNAERFDKLRSALGTGLSPRWGSSPAAQTNAGTPATVVQVANSQPPAPVGAWRWRGGLYHRAMDSAANCQADREAFRDSLSLRSCVASDDGSKMDVAETAAPSHAEKRASHRTLEETAVARVKKKPKDLGPISYSSTKADSSSSLTCARPGRRSAIPRSSDTATRGSGFLPSPQSVSPHRASGLAFTSVSTAPILRGWRSSVSCVTFCATCADRLCCSGMAAPSTGASSLRSSFANTSGSMYIDFRPMPQNSIPMSLCGPKPNTLWPMVRQRTWLSLHVDSAALFIASGALSGFFGPAFTLRSCHGPELAIYPLFMRVSILQANDGTQHRVYRRLSQLSPARAGPPRRARRRRSRRRG